MLTLDLSFRIRMRPVDRREREFIGLTLVYTNSEATKTNLSLKVSEEQQFAKGKEIREGEIRTSIVPTKDYLQMKNPVVLIDGVLTLEPTAHQSSHKFLEILIHSL